MSLIRVVSYNIHKGRSFGGRDALADLRLGLHGLRPDVLFLQEVQGRNDLHVALHAQHESLAAALHMEVAYGCNAVRNRTDHEDISDHRLEQRGLLHGVINKEGREIHCFVVHLGLFARGRERQISQIMDRINRTVPGGAPVLIAGDFNDWNDRLAPLFVRQLGMVEVFAEAPLTHGEVPRLRESVRRLGGMLRGDPEPGIARVTQVRINQIAMSGMSRISPPPRTFPSAFPWLRLDRIYQRGFAVRSARVLRGRPWTQISDHAPIIAELELP